jgi:hypothetical protein
MTASMPTAVKYSWNSTNSLRVGTSGQSTIATRGSARRPSHSS